MEDQLISFETAKLAKEKGCYISGFPRMYNQDGKFGSPYEETYPAYTQSLLQRWLREFHKIHVWVQPNLLWETYYHRGILDRKDTHKTNLSFDGDSMEAYEDALESGLLKALKLINS
jgi:hypothetical protein